MEQFFPLQFPYTLGTDLAGRVEEIGPDVLGWSIGDRVIARTDPTAGGAMAEYVVVPARYLTTAPSTVPLDDAAGIDRKSPRLNYSHKCAPRMPASACKK